MEAVRIRVPFDALDLATAEPFVRWAKDELACTSVGRRRRVSCSTSSAVEFVMAAGVQAMLDLEDELRRTRRTLAVANVAPIVVRVLEICDVADRWMTD